MRRIGAEIAAAERWKERGAAYVEHIDGAYHQHRLEVIRALLPGLHGLDIVDFGCGEGVLIRDSRLAGAASITGIDIDPGMLEQAQDAGADRLLLGSVDQLAKIDAADCIIAANVAAYFTSGEDDLFYRECRRILRPGGSLIITHSNELFDLYTLNAFTASFYDRYFGIDARSLLSHPDKPNRTTFNIRENPLAYGEKLQRFDFKIERIEYMNRHLAPPLLTRDDPDDMQRARPDTLNIPAAEHWKLMFQCSMFGVQAIAA